MTGNTLVGREDTAQMLDLDSWPIAASVTVGIYGLQAAKWLVSLMSLKTNANFSFAPSRLYPALRPNSAV
jgi:hypothetical protein